MKSLSFVVNEGIETNCFLIGGSPMRGNVIKLMRDVFINWPCSGYKLQPLSLAGGVEVLHVTLFISDHQVEVGQ